VLRLPPPLWQAGLRCSDSRAENLNVASPAPTKSAPCVCGRAALAIRPAFGERQPRDSDATAPTVSRPETRRAWLGDAGEAEPEPRLRECFYKTQGLLNRNSKRPRAMCAVERTNKEFSARSFLRT
jgi:hypothetical protein